MSRASESEIVELIHRLESEDQGEMRVAGDRLIEHGTAARPHLVAAIRSESTQARRAAAHLLGRIEASPVAVMALVVAIEDSDAKVRKNAAVSLGRLCDATSFPALAAALEREQVAWVRPSIILALGGIGGQEVQRLLQSVDPLSKLEKDAIRKAIDRSTQRKELARWRTSCHAAEPVYAAVPVGLEDVAVDEAVSRGLTKPVVAGSGKLLFEAGHHPVEIISALRCIYGVQLLVGQSKIADRLDDENLYRAVSSLLDEPLFLGNWRDWIECEDQCLFYRFMVKGTRVSRKLFSRLLELARSRLGHLQLEDRTSNYDIELRIEVSEEQTYIWAVPVFQKDDRFSYRVADVGASINPVVGACLARMVRSHDSSIVVDQTCGSATLLVERALLDPGVKLLGADVSPTAVRAAVKNVEAAGLSQRITIKRGNAIQAATWTACDEALMNLPFGIRSASQDKDLPRLYAATVEHLAKYLSQQGSAVLYTASVKLLESCLAKHRSKLTVEKRRRVLSGGLNAVVWLIRRC